jgi:hypothetical protein
MFLEIFPFHSQLAQQLQWIRFLPGTGALKSRLTIDIVIRSLRLTARIPHAVLSAVPSGWRAVRRVRSLPVAVHEHDPVSIALLFLCYERITRALHPCAALVFSTSALAAPNVLRRQSLLTFIWDFLEGSNDASKDALRRWMR